MDLPNGLSLTDGTVSLRDWRIDDAPMLRAACGDSGICRFTSVPECYTYERASAWIDRMHQLRLAGEALALAVLDGEHRHPIGNVNVNPIGGDGREVSLGYWIVESARGNGFAVAAARLLSDWALAELRVRRIELAILPGNSASHRVAERLGARREGVRTDSHVDQGKAWDMVIYSIVPSPGAHLHVASH